MQYQLIGNLGLGVTALALVPVFHSLIILFFNDYGIWDTAYTSINSYLLSPTNIRLEYRKKKTP